eukprot:gene10263-2682_t
MSVHYSEETVNIYPNVQGFDNFDTPTQESVEKKELIQKQKPEENIFIFPTWVTVSFGVFFYATVLVVISVHGKSPKYYQYLIEYKVNDVIHREITEDRIPLELKDNQVSECVYFVQKVDII